MVGGGLLLTKDDRESAATHTKGDSQHMISGAGVYNQ